MSSNIILNIPHASTLLTLSDISEKYKSELLYMTDWFTDELYINGIGKPLVAPISRLLCDMERFKDDDKEEMSKRGMGVCYINDHNLKALASFDTSHKLEMIKNYYEPYHRMLCCYTAEALSQHRYVLILDCHSFSDSPYLCDINRDVNRPDICIGTDKSHTPDNLIKLTRCYFEREGYSVKLNSPFSGTIIPNGFENDNHLLSMMIEINRKLYMKIENNK